MGKKSRKKDKATRRAAPKPTRQAATKPAGVAAAHLQFPPGERCGLTPIAMSGAWDKSPPAIVREILQNSLDAAQAAEQDCASVLFSLETVAVKDIPGISEYENALRKVGECCERSGWTAQSKSRFNAIKGKLSQKSLPVLFVSDNGIGLGCDKMSAILSDGINDKDKPGLGSHGNGHFTTFNLSELRYILYGGVSKVDGKIAAGHAILASHKGKAGEQFCGKDGYFISGFDWDNEKVPYKFPRGESVLPFIADKLRDIESQWGTGALLAVVGFDNFGEDDSSFDMTANLILGAAVRNFFVAVHRKKLVVDVVSVSGGDRKTLNAKKLDEVMREMSPALGRTPKFISHEKANRFYHLFAENGKRESGVNEFDVKTKGGIFKVLYRESGAASTRISLCRNGMWITDDVPSVKSGDFAGHAPFEATVLCDEMAASKLVCMAEGAQHNSLVLKYVADSEQRALLRNALQQVRSELQNRITKRSSESIDFIEMDGVGGSVEAIPGRTAPKGEVIKPIPPPRPRPPGPRPPRPPGPRPPRPQTSSSWINVRCVAVRTDNKIKMRILPQESLKTGQEAELRLVRNDGSDVSCDLPGADSTRIRLTKVVCGGEQCAVDEGGLSARIGVLNENESKEVYVEFANPQSKRDYKVDCEFVRRAVRT